MKTTAILYFLALIVGVMSSKYAERIAEAENKCIDDFHLNQTEIEEIMNLPILPEDNEDFSNFLNCVWNETEFKNSDGSINFENIVSAELEKYDFLNYFLKMAMSMYLQSLTPLCENQNVNSTINAVKTLNCIKKYNRDIQNLMENN